MSAGVFTQSPTSTEYIGHHLGYWTVGDGFFQVHLDTVIVSILLGTLFILLGWWLGKGLRVDSPSRLQNAVESIIEFVDNQTRPLFPGHDPLVGPLALTIFLWVFIMNIMDIIPVDLVPLVAQWIGANVFGVPAHEVHFRLVPTAGLAPPAAMALTVFALTIFYGIRSKGPLGYSKGFFTHPFGIYLAPFNFIMSVIEEIAKPISLALRLFGNMFAGELIFMLVALLGYSYLMLPAQLALGWVWTVFEVLIILIQAFIFMLLSVVYLAMATSDEAH